MGGGWRSDTSLRHSVVDEPAGNSQLAAVAFSTDSKSGMNGRNGSETAWFHSHLTETAGTSELQAKRFTA